jgi:DNA helicase II / ATP-dependent DNA helicase PcrA
MLPSMATKPSVAAKVFEPDARQRQAIEHVGGPMLVVAGAGTGKTTVLIQRIVELVRKGHARLDEILALTYTDNAAEEMRDRITAEFRDVRASRLQASTFHAYCNNLLIRHRRNFGVLDEKDLWIYLRRRIRELRLNYFVRAANVSKFLDDLLSFIGRCQDELVGPEKYTDYVRKLERGELPIPRVCKSKDAENLTDEDVLDRCREIASVFRKVEEMLAADNFGTFGHMITRAYELLRSDSQLLERERQSARFILVDEFQDANFAQVKLLQQLAGEAQNLFAVGDPDQAIYRFRGASSAAFALFERNFPNAETVVLQKNRRSTTPILKCAFTLIAKNPESFGKNAGLSYKRAPLVSAREEEAATRGETLASLPVEAVLFSPKGKDLECSDVASILKQQHRQLRCKWSDFAILYRINTHHEELVEELAEQNIPYTIENMNVLDTREARDLLACMGAVVSAKDDACLFRIAALPQFTIDPEQLRAGIRALPRDVEHGGVASVLERIAGGEAVLNELQEARDEIGRTSARSLAALGIIIRRFALDPASPALAAILEFVKRWEEKPIVKTGELAELLEYLEYFREAHGAIAMGSTVRDAVHLMTVHAAKGLEFPHVFILRANSGSFPASYKEPLVEFPRELWDADSVAAQDDKTLYEEEERRLFYVAMTRARDSLRIYAKGGTGRDPTPAGYLRDLLKDASLKAFLRQREARGFQPDLFAQAAPSAITRLNQWVALPPASDLSARLSASAVQTYENCPLQFKLDREWRIPGEVPAAMQYGASMHRVLHAYYDSVRFGRTMTEEAVIELFRSDLQGAHIEDPYQRDLYAEQGVQQLKDFMAAAKTTSPEVIHTEESFAVRLGDVLVVGRIDRVDRSADGQISITDYKTGKPLSQDDADESLQLSIYALAAKEKWGYRADRLAFYNLAENTAVLTSRNEAQLQEAKARVEKVASRIAAGDFQPKRSFNCQFCAYRNLCPATEKQLYAIDKAKN